MPQILICGIVIDILRLTGTEIGGGAYNILYNKERFEVNFSMNHCHGFLHIVKKGDTLYLLSRRYHVPLWAVLQANPYVNIYNLQVGDEICIPCKIQPKEGYDAAYDC